MGVYVSDHNGKLSKYAGSSPLLLPSAKKILDLIYPVGSIYMSMNNVSPAYFIGGTWERIHATFLFAASDNYPAGSTGGEKEHKLTEYEIPYHNHTYRDAGSVTKGHILDESEIPAHTHSVWSTDSWSNNAVGLNHENKAYGVAGVDASNGKEEYILTESGDDAEIIGSTGNGLAHTHGLDRTVTVTSSTGNTGPHNNMPPYLAVYMWKRIS